MMMMMMMMMILLFCLHVGFLQWHFEKMKGIREWERRPHRHGPHGRHGRHDACVFQIGCAHAPGSAVFAVQGTLQGEIVRDGLPQFPIFHLFRVSVV